MVTTSLKNAVYKKSFIDENQHIENGTQFNQIIVLHSDARISVDDSLIPALSWYKDFPEEDIESSTLERFINQKYFIEFRKSLYNLPLICQNCEVKNICKGGDVENRFSSLNGFDNPSVYCGGLKKFYLYIISWLLKNGYPKDRINEVLHR